MYSGSFFRHTDKMLALLKDVGLIRSGIRSQSGELKGGYWNRVSHFHVAGKSRVLKQFMPDEGGLFGAEAYRTSWIPVVRTLKT